MLKNKFVVTMVTESADSKSRSETKETDLKYDGCLDAAGKVLGDCLLCHFQSAPACVSVIASALQHIDTATDNRDHRDPYVKAADNLFKAAETFFEAYKAAQLQTLVDFHTLDAPSTVG
jgi:hypothetical protein